MANKRPQPSSWVQTAGLQYMWRSCQAPWQASRFQSLVSRNNHTITTADWKWMVTPNIISRHTKPYPWVMTALAAISVARLPRHMVARLTTLIDNERNVNDILYYDTPNKIWLSMSDHTHIRWRVASMVSQVGFRSLPAAITQHQWIYNTNI